MIPQHPYDDTLRYLERQRRWDRRIAQLQRSTYHVVGVGLLVCPLVYLLPTTGIWFAVVLLAASIIPPVASLAFDGLDALIERHNRPRT